MKILTHTIATLATGALMAAAIGCTKDPAPDSMRRDVIIETGYVECSAPAGACNGVALCVEANDAQICVQAPADQCVDALTCDCVGDWVCGALPCADLDGGFTCGDDPEPPPPPSGCLRLAPNALDFGRVLVSNTKAVSLTVIADCPATLHAYALLDDSDPAYSLTEGLELVEFAEGDSIEVIVQVEPMEAGQLTGTLRLNEDPALDVPLTTEAVRPIGGNCLMADLAAVDFGAVPVGQTARRSIQVSANCDGNLMGTLDDDTPATGEFAFIGSVDGPVQAGEGFEVIIELTAIAPGDVRGVFDLGGVGQPISLRLAATAVEPLPDCRRDAGVGCLGGLTCNDLGACVAPIRFRLELEDGAPAAYIQRWPTDAPHVVIDDADGEFTGFNPGSIFKPCDACDPDPDCAERVPTVGAVGQVDDLIWSQTWWRTDTPDGDDCARPAPFPDGNYLATFCFSREAELDGAFDDDGLAPGVIGESVCLDPVAFTIPAAGDVVGVVPAP